MRDELTRLLQSLEMELRAQDRWDLEPPSPQALRSEQPFAVDTLSFDQWLQWILLPRLHDLLCRQLPLPTNCAIRPMAEEMYENDDAGGARLIMILGHIDTLLSDRDAGLN